MSVSIPAAVPRLQRVDGCYGRPACAAAHDPAPGATPVASGTGGGAISRRLRPTTDWRRAARWPTVARDASGRSRAQAIAYTPTRPSRSSRSWRGLKTVVIADLTQLGACSAIDSAAGSRSLHRRMPANSAAVAMMLRAPMSQPTRHARRRAAARIGSDSRARVRAMPGASATSSSSRDSGSAKPCELPSTSDDRWNRRPAQDLSRLDPVMRSLEHGTVWHWVGGREEVDPPRSGAARCEFERGLDLRLFLGRRGHQALDRDHDVDQDVYGCEHGGRGETWPPC